MRDRLKKLILESGILCSSCGEFSCYDCSEYIADYIIKNGGIMPPCKVGVEVYFAVKESDRIFKGELISFSLDAAHFWFFCRYYCGLSFWHQVEDFGKTVFLTSEEAEQALKGECNAEIH